jgi:hypothetical protein
MKNSSGKVSPTHRPPLPPGIVPGTHFCFRLSQPQGHSAAGRIMLMKNSSDTIGNRTRDIPACSTVRHRVPPLLYGSAAYLERFCSAEKDQLTPSFKVLLVNLVVAELFQFRTSLATRKFLTNITAACY